MKGDKAIRVRRRGAVGAVTALAGLVALSAAGVPWLNEQVTAPSKPSPAATPSGDLTPDRRQTIPATPEPTSDPTPIGEPTEPAAVSDWARIDTSGVNTEWSQAIHDAVVADGVTVAVGYAASEPTTPNADVLGWRPSVWLSSNASEWRAATVETDGFPETLDTTMQAVAANTDGTLVAVGDGTAVDGTWRAFVWRSTDNGESWDLMPFSDQTKSQTLDVTWAGDRFVIVGSTSAAADDRYYPAVWTSSDGTRWEQSTIDSGNSLLQRVAWSPDIGIVASSAYCDSCLRVTGDPAADPSTWAATEGPLLYGLAPTHDGFVAVVDYAEGPDGKSRLVSSSDGVTWDIVPGSDALYFPKAADEEGQLRVLDVHVDDDGVITVAGRQDDYRHTIIWQSTHPDDLRVPGGAEPLSIVDTAEGTLVFGTEAAGDALATEIVVWHRR